LKLKLSMSFKKKKILMIRSIIFIRLVMCWFLNHIGSIRRSLRSRFTEILLQRWLRQKKILMKITISTQPQI